ncbi:MAG: hypothetical protein D6773_12280 [Alphaproteobacteria bacterium]|nr:MAG: hypothetical protein D6773_12280 [Alphaproteobacteria bacterium]
MGIEPRRPCGAVEERDLKLLLERLHLLAYRRGGDMQMLGGGGETAVIRDRDKGSEGGKVHAPTISNT